MGRRSYTADEKAAALDLYATEGPSAVQTKLGIPKATVSDWARANNVRTFGTERTQAATAAHEARWAERRALMVDEIGHVAHLALGKAESSVRAGKPRDAKDYATTLAILVDKAQLLGGDATTRHENRELRDRLLEEARTNARHLRVA